MEGARAGEPVLLETRWVPWLIALSIVVSLLGSWTATVLQVMANSCARNSTKLAWTAGSSIAFGLSSIWSLHFLALQAQIVGVPLFFDPWISALSAGVAVLFTFLALSSDVFAQMLSPRRKRRRKTHSSSRPHTPLIEERQGLLSDVEGQQAAAMDEATGRPMPVRLSTAEMSGPMEDLSPMSMPLPPDPDAPGEVSAPVSRVASPAPRNRTASPGGLKRVFRFPFPAATRRVSDNESTATSSGERSAGADTTPAAPSGTPQTATLSRRSSMGQASASGSHLDASVTDSEDSHSQSTGSSTGLSWLDYRLSREARARQQRPSRNFVLDTVAMLLAGLTSFNLAKAAVWATAIVTMHYSGNASIRVEGGHVSVSMPVMLLAWSIAFVVCTTGVVMMTGMEAHVGRQLLFTVLATTGVAAMHFTSQILGTNFYSSVTPDFSRRSQSVTIAILVTAMSTLSCFVASSVLAHQATASRLALAEVIIAKRRAWRLQAEKDAAEQASRLRSDFVATASHELRSPLHTISGYSELLARTDLSTEQRLYVESITRACTSLGLITQSVLDFSKLENGGTEAIRLASLDVRAVFRDLVAQCWARAMHDAVAASVTLIVAVDRDVPELLWADETLLSRIVVNLTSNALKFTGEGYVSIRFSWHPEASEIVICVSDSGVGVPAKQQDSIFQPFRQADSSLSRRFQMRLGLAICRQLVQRLEGTIDLTSKEGHGSSFRVVLPLSRDMEPTPSPEPAALVPMRRIALACDNSRTQAELATILSSRGYLVSEVIEDEMIEHILSQSDTLLTDLDYVMSRPKLVQRIHSVDALPTVLMIRPEVDLGKPRIARMLLGDIARIRLPLVVHELTLALDDFDGFIRQQARLPDKPKLVRFQSESSGTTASEEAAEPSDSEGETSPSVGDSMTMAPVPSLLDQPDPPPLETSETPSAEPAKPIWLLVEDNVINAKMGQRILEKLGYQCVLAYDGQQAIDVLLRDPPSTYTGILMDLHMPVMDGLAASRKLRELEQGVLAGRKRSLLALTANVSAEAQAAAIEAGCDGFLCKPLTIQKMALALRQYSS